MKDERTEEKNEKRPNANYALSKPDNSIPQNDGVIYHYNRERRLANAPKEVQDLYKPQKQSRLGFFGVLVADRPRRMLLLVILFLCVGIFVLLRTGFFDTNYVLDGNVIEITGTKFEGTTIVILRKIARNEDAYNGAVEIAVSVPVSEDTMQYPVFYHRIFFTMEKDEVYRFAVPYDDPELLMVLNTEKSSLQLKFNPL